MLVFGTTHKNSCFNSETFPYKCTQISWRT